MKKWIPLIAVIPALLWTLVFVGFVEPHEGHGFTHTKRIGIAIGGRGCPGNMTEIWTLDENNDGVADKCATIFLDHNEFHVKYTEPAKDGKCYCWEEEED